MRRTLAIILIFQIVGLGCPPLTAWADTAATSTPEFADSGTTDELPENDIAADEDGSSHLIDILDSAAASLNQSGKNSTDEAIEPAEQEKESDGETTIDADMAADTDDAANEAKLESDGLEAVSEPTSATSTLDTAADDIATALPVNEALEGLSVASDALILWDAPEPAAATSSVVFIDAAPPAALAQFIVSGDGRITEHIEPSGRYGAVSKFKLCAIIANADKTDTEEVYGQIFYPKNAGFGPADIRGRVGCGQVSGGACRMNPRDLRENDPIWDLIAGDSEAPVFFAGGVSRDDVDGGNGALEESAAVYCCDRELAYDDIAGTYETLVMARSINGEYSNALAGVFDYIEKPAFELDFGAVDYGLVAADIETGAQSNGQTATPLVRNTGNTRLIINISQDDMGLADEDGNSLIFYRARLGDEEEVVYGSGEAVDLPGAVDLSAIMPLSFSVLVSKYPAREPQSAPAYRGKMVISAKNNGNYECFDYAVGKAIPAAIDADFEADGLWEAVTIGIRDESGEAAFKGSGK